MKQNINLYRRADTRLRLNAGVWPIAIVWLMVVSVLGVTQWRLDRQNAQLSVRVNDAQQQAEQIETELNAATAAMTTGADQALETQLDDALQALALGEKIVALLKGNTAGDVEGFSNRLRSLARQQAPGVWLTHVRVAAPDGRTTLKGRALNPGSVPVYLRQLSLEPALTGQRFDDFQIERPDDTSDGVAVYFALKRSASADGTTP